MTLKGLFAAVLFGCSAWGMTAHAAQRELVVGVEELDYFPAYSVQSGEYVGAAREILDAFAAANGYSLTYKPQPIKRLYAELLSGGIDLKFPDNPRWATDVKTGQDVAYSNPVINYVDGVLVRPNLAGRDMDTIRTLGTVSGFTPFAWLDRIKAGQVQVKENPRMELLLKQAAIGRFDGAYGSVAVAGHILDDVLKTPDALVFDPTLPHSRDSYRLSSRNNPQVVAEFNAWMAANAATVKAIKNRTGAEKGVQ